MFESCRAHFGVPLPGSAAVVTKGITMAPTPDFLTLKRNRDLEGLRTAGLVVRRVSYAILGAIAVLALLNVFGQRPTTTAVTAPAAHLELYAPAHLRGGLLFMARFRITAAQNLKNATLVLAPGWAENMQINTIEPSPTNESSDNGRLVLELGPIKAGDSFLLFMQFQVNPTNVGRHDQDVELRDGNQHISTIRRTVTVYP